MPGFSGAKDQRPLPGGPTDTSASVILEPVARPHVDFTEPLALGGVCPSDLCLSAPILWVLPAMVLSPHPPCTLAPSPAPWLLLVIGWLQCPPKVAPQSLQLPPARVLTMGPMPSAPVCPSMGPRREQALRRWGRSGLGQQASFREVKREPRCQRTRLKCQQVLASGHSPFHFPMSGERETVP